MQIFKFGGASVKDAAAVKNVGVILNLFPAGDLLVVISAMGKTTNLLEKVADAVFNRRPDAAVLLGRVKEFHIGIAQALFPDKAAAVYTELSNTFVELDWAVEEEHGGDFDFFYDQVVSFGELLSTKIISAYLGCAGFANQWVDARDFIKTDDTYREAEIDWVLTESCCTALFSGGPGLTRTPGAGKRVVITQGFIGSTFENYTTTLGREGSDFTAAVFAWCCNAESVTIWKDVPGILNADPKWFEDTRLIEQLSYQDAIELAYYGASVIHPKTIKPLQNKNIPLYVRSFLEPEKTGTVINSSPAPLRIPGFIFKVDQVLISVSPKDFSFITEENLGDLFRLFSELGVKINTMQNSAISFSVCVDQHAARIPLLLEKLKRQYRVLYNTGVELATIRYYDQGTIERVITGKRILLEVKSRYTVQLVMMGLHG